MHQANAYLDATAQKKCKLRKKLMFFKSKVEEVLYASTKDIDNYFKKVISKNLGLSTVVVDYRFSQEIHTPWKKINPLIQELHLNHGTLENRKSIKLFQDADTTQILRKLRALANLNNPVQYQELLLEFLKKKLVLHSYTNEPLTYQSILDWRAELKEMKEEELKAKLLSAMEPTVYGISTVFNYIDKEPIFDIEKVLQRNESLYLTTGLMCKDATTRALGNLFLLDILKWIESRNSDNNKKDSTPYVVIVDYQNHDQTIITEITKRTVRAGVQLVLTN